MNADSSGMINNVGLERFYDSVQMLNHATGHFFQKEPVTVTPEYIHSNYTEWLVLYFFSILFLLVIVWYFFPERMFKILYNEDSKKVKRISNSQFTNPGFYLYSLVFITFISSTTVVVYFILKHFLGDKFLPQYDTPQALGILTVGIFAYYTVRFLIILFVGIIFNSLRESKKLLEAFLKVDMMQGIFLIPIIFFIYFSSETISIYTAIVVLLLFIAYKWYKIFFMGLSSSNVSVFHNILYLCSLEIIPVFTLMKLMDFYQRSGF